MLPFMTESIHSTLIFIPYPYPIKSADNKRIICSYVQKKKKLP
ncbi:conserved hypothetical protein [Bacillus pumilus ATCC 7061]|nr:conserved hypothetical protein [Bacillus pumilus ATCC 7061]